MAKEGFKLNEICEAFLDKAMEIYDVPSVALGVMVGDERFTGARGYRNYLTKDPIDKDDVYHCASASKMMTAMGIMKLVDEKKIDLNDRLVDLLPYWEMEDERCQRIKLYQLLCHTSGMHDVPVEDWEEKWSEKVVDPGSIKRYVTSDEVIKGRMLCEPGTGGFIYSSIGYELLGAVIEETSGKLFNEFIKENCFLPAGMDNTTVLTIEGTDGSLELEDIDKLRMAMPHERDENRNFIMAKYYPYSRQHAPSSTLTTNVADMLKWGRFNLDRKAFSDETYDKMWQGYATVPNNGEKMGLGWFMREQDGHHLIGHEGTDIGFRASFWMCPKLDMTIAVLSNVSAAPVKRINKAAFEEVTRSL